jgi:hypothetical protein
VLVIEYKLTNIQQLKIINKNMRIPNIKIKKLKEKDFNHCIKCKKRISHTIDICKDCYKLVNSKGVK